MSADGGVRMSHLVKTAVLLLCGAAPVFAETTVGPDELRQAAIAAIQGGEPGIARSYGNALLARDPDDMNAYLIIARAARDLGNISAARDATRTAWSLAETPSEKYSAALITAQVLATDGKRTRAQLWLRRAAQYAPNDALRARAERDFGYVKLRNPWQTDLTFTFAPNSNINNAGTTERGFIYVPDSPFPFGFDIAAEHIGDFS